MVYTNIYNNLNVCVNFNSYLIVQCEQCLCLTLSEQRVSFGKCSVLVKRHGHEQIFLCYQILLKHSQLATLNINIIFG